MSKGVTPARGVWTPRQLGAAQVGKPAIRESPVERLMTRLGTHATPVFYTSTESGLHLQDSQPEPAPGDSSQKELIRSESRCGNFDTVAIAPAVRELDHLAPPSSHPESALPA